MTLPLLITVCAAISAFLLAFSFVPAPNPLAKRIERMQRVTEPSHSVRMAKFEEIFRAENASKTRSRLAEAGWYHATPATIAMRSAAGFGTGIVIAIALAAVLPNKGIAFLIGGCISLVGWRMPKMALDRAIKARKRGLERALPDFLDLLCTTVKAGMALNGAMVQATEATQGPLQDELRSALAEIRLGRARAEALSAMAERANEPQLRAMVTSIVQAETLGSNVAQILGELAEDTRNRRWLNAEERAAQLPIKMLFPMALLMLPSLYVMIFGPVAAELIGK